MGSPFKIIRFINNNYPNDSDVSSIIFESTSIDAYADNLNNYITVGSVISFAELSRNVSIQIDKSSPYIGDNWIHFNKDTILLCGSSSIIKNNIIEDNSGSGIVIYNQAPKIIKNILRRNKSINGGGIFVSNSNSCITSGSINNILIDGNIIDNNMAENGAGIALFNGPATIKYNNIINNKSHTPDKRAAIFIDGNSTYSITNNNIWDSSLYEIYLNNNVSENVDASNNYWYTNDSTIIAERIRDKNDASISGFVDFSEWLGYYEQHIKTSPRISLNGTTKKQIADFRIQKVNEYYNLNLFSVNYDPLKEPGNKIYGSITDGADWMEDTQYYICNPYLLMIITYQNYIRPFEFSSQVSEIKYFNNIIEEIYDKESARRFFLDLEYYMIYAEAYERVVELWMVNAYDAGYLYANIDIDKSANIKPYKDTSTNIINSIYSNSSFYHYGR
ncbi:right-handed parallel beta-helix repeat-containing protein [Candidatus Desantisbacteria bacterium]|nr:right-handed parallel beta-helix repeat-containing protein [Candidatus Desantisbacteria bacterium]